MRFTKILCLILCFLMVIGMFVSCKKSDEVTQTETDAQSETEAETKNNTDEKNDEDTTDTTVEDEVPSDSIAITSIEDIVDLNAKYHLTADIGSAEAPNGCTVKGKFKGVLDGCGFTVYTNVPLFDELNGVISLTDDGANVPSEVKNLTIAGNIIDYEGTVLGAVANTAKGPTKLTNITNNATLTLMVWDGSDVTTKGSRDMIHVGGLIGVANMGASFENCKNNGEILIDGAKGIRGLGGIVGYVELDVYTLTNCENTAKLSSTDQEKADVFYAGGIIGQAKCLSLTIENCQNSGEITTSKETYENANRVGGILGCSFEIDSRESNYTIKNCFNSGNIKSQSLGGGIAAAIRGNATISDCKNTGNITITITDTSKKVNFLYGAGILADIRTDHKENNVYVDKSVSIQRCSNGGNITVSQASESYAGGIIGANFLSVSITDCANYGTLDAKTAVGGIIARIKNPVASMTLTVTNALSLGTLTGTKADAFYGVNQATTGCTVTFTKCYAVGVNSLTEDALKGDTAKTTLEGFDFENVWQANANSYPTLK